MTFLHPLILGAGLGAIALPIAIHFLMRRRRKPVQWAAMRFLLEAYRQQRRRLQFEQWLLLAARCLLVALIAMGLARPLIGGAGLGGAQPRELFILIDDSLASAARAPDGTTALERHKAAARAALASLDPGRGDRAALITLAGPANPVVMPPSTEPGAIRDLIEALEPTDSATDLEGGLARVAELIADAEDDADRVVLLLTDWRRGSFDENDELPQLPPTVRVVASPAAAGALDNQQITSVRPLRAVVLAGEAGARDTAASAQQVRVELRRLGESLAESEGVLVLRLDRVGPAGTITSDGPGLDQRSPRIETPFRWDAGQTELTLVAPLPAINDPSPGIGVLTAEIRVGAGLDAIPGDGVMRRVVDVRRTLRVGVVARSRFGVRTGIGDFEPSDWLIAALDPGGLVGGGRTSAIEPVPVEPSALDTARLAGLDAVFVLEPAAVDERGWANLAAFTRGGGMTVLTPSPMAGAALWTRSAVGAFDLAVDFATEPTEFDPPLAIAPPTGDDLGPLSLLDAEVRTLSGPVRTFRALMLRAEAGAPPRTLRPLLTLSNGEPLLAIARSRMESEGGEGATGGGSPGLLVIFTAAIDPDWTDLPARPLFVPLVQELVRQGVGEARGSSAVPAGARATGPSGAVELVDLASDRRLRLEASGVTAEPVRRAGAFAVLDGNGAMRTLAIVNPDAGAGRTEPTTSEALTARLDAIGAETAVFADVGAGGVAGSGDLAERVTTALNAGGEDGQPISWVVLLAAIVLALGEMALARRASHAEAGPVGRSVRSAVGRGVAA